MAVPFVELNFLETMVQICINDKKIHLRYVRRMENQDEYMMQKALALSKKARVIAPPNPWVGCVIVNDGQIVGQGYTQPVGSSHAEVVALREAGSRAKGATAYVTLEPCCHFGRTPPCTKALIEAKVSKVVIGLKDPDSNVSGKGIEELKSAGIDVTLGVAEESIHSLLTPYLYHRQTGLPYCIGKAAISIDGRIAAKDGSSKWISSLKAREEGHRLRAESQAIIIGAKTASSDLPRLTIRHESIVPSKPPLRVVLDSRGSVLPKGPLFEEKEAPTLIVTTEKAPKKIKEQWQAAGVEVATVSLDPCGSGVDLQELLELLGKRNILQVLVEGGGTLLGGFMEKKILQTFHAFIGPCFLGNEGLPLLKTSIPSIGSAFNMQLADVRLFDDTVNINYINASC